MTGDELEQRLRAHYRAIDPTHAPQGLGLRIEDALGRRPSRPAFIARTRPAFAAAIAAVVIVAVGLGLRPGGFLSSPGASPTPPASPQPGSPSPSAAQSVGLVHVYDVQPDLMAASGGRLYGVVISGSGSGAVVLRIDPDGAITRHTVSDPSASYFSQLIDQGSSLYLGTSVIKRFTSTADELLRVDPSTLTVITRTTLPGGVVGGLVSDAQNIWVALADRVLRLDPVSLAVRASYVIPGAVPPPGGSSSIDSLALGPGGLWATYEDTGSRTLYRFDPASLTALGRIVLPDPGQVAGVVADPESVWLTGTDWVQRVDPTGQLADPTLLSGLQVAAAQGRGLVALVYEGSGAEAFVQLDAKGVVVGRSEVGDAGGRLAVDGRDAWLLQGLSVAHWTLFVPQP
jgi:hypothetical protein